MSKDPYYYLGYYVGDDYYEHDWGAPTSCRDSPGYFGHHPVTSCRDGKAWRHLVDEQGQAVVTEKGEFIVVQLSLADVASWLHQPVRSCRDGQMYYLVDEQGQPITDESGNRILVRVPGGQVNNWAFTRPGSCRDN